MASNYTSNYNLCQWAASDKVLRTEFNADNAKIDAAIKAVNQRVNGKVDQAALNALSQSVSEETARRNCRIVTGSYTGHGKYGSANPNVLTFAYKPVFLCVMGSGTALSLVAVRGQTASLAAWGGNTGTRHITWNDRSVSWYAQDSLSDSLGTAYQMSLGTFYYFAVLEL